MKNWFKEEGWNPSKKWPMYMIKDTRQEEMKKEWYIGNIYWKIRRIGF